VEASLHDSSKKLPDRIAVLRSAQAPLWQSAQCISTNLAFTYDLAFGPRCRNFSVPETDQYAESWRIAQAVHAYGPRRIVFLANQPHPEHFLTALKLVYGLSRLPELVFHVYGDFPLGSPLWLKAWSILSGTQCLFLAASPRQQEVLKRLLGSPANSAFFPFPVNNQVFRFDESLRAKWRKKLGLSPAHRVLIYSGRISLQKNVSLLIEEAAQLMREDPQLRLWLCGASDDIGAPLFDWNHLTGSYDMRIARQLEQLEPDVRGRIWRMGAVPHETLRALYNAADGFVSLSLYHDEDFGMAAAEAAMCGLPLCLTGWGGYSQFVQNPEDGLGIPVGLDQNGLRIHRPQIRDGLRKLAGGYTDKKEREARSARAILRFGIEANARVLHDLHAEPVPVFRGFTKLMQALSYQQGSSTISYPGGPGSTPTYAHIYSAYYQPLA
jgi:glycosyltransferase involved in cell wall biosynthesis